MNPFIDTHCHLDSILDRMKLSSFAELRTRFFPPDFAGCVTISCDPESIDPALGFMENPGVYGAFGIHPHESKHYSPELAERIGTALRNPKCVAYGEIGLDYHYDFSPRETQREAFIRQIEVGIATEKPLIIHTREAEEDTLAMMKENIPSDWPMHVHCFTSSARLAEQLLSNFSRLMIGFTGIVTFKNGDGVRAAARLVPLERMLVETDGPYLAPDPHRGQPAHPGHIPLIVAKLAAIKERDVADVGAVLLANAKKLYGITA
jgi:TatD DNase family protein